MAISSQATRIQRIRTTTSDLHDQLEQTGVAHELQHGTISRKRYLVLHAQLFRIHQVLERLYHNAQTFVPTTEASMSHSEALYRDLAVLDGLPMPVALEPTRIFRRQMNEANPSSAYLLGTEYVIQGARFGARVLIEPVAEALDVPPVEGQGLDYYIQSQENLPDQWRTLQQQINDLPLGTEQELDIEDGARDLMTHLLAIYRAV